MNTNLRQFFDAGRLDEQQLGMIEFVLNSPAYNDSFKPYLLSIRDNMNALMLDRSAKRKEILPDDYLAGAIAAIDGLLKLFTILIHETSIERIHSAMAEMSPDRQYDAEVARGKARPVVGLDQSATPQRVSPDEDY